MIIKYAPDGRKSSAKLACVGGRAVDRAGADPRPRPQGLQLVAASALLVLPTVGEEDKPMSDFLPRHRVVAEFDHEQKEGWVSVNKGFAMAREAQDFFIECTKDPTCIRAQQILVRTYERKTV